MLSAPRGISKEKYLLSKLYSIQFWSISGIFAYLKFCSQIIKHKMHINDEISYCILHIYAHHLSIINIRAMKVERMGDESVNYIVYLCSLIDEKEQSHAFCSRIMRRPVTDIGMISKKLEKDYNLVKNLQRKLEKQIQKQKSSVECKDIEDVLVYSIVRKIKWNDVFKILINKKLVLNINYNPDFKLNQELKWIMYLMKLIFTQVYFEIFEIRFGITFGRIAHISFAQNEEIFVRRIIDYEQETYECTHKEEELLIQQIIKPKEFSKFIGKYSQLVLTKYSNDNFGFTTQRMISEHRKNIFQRTFKSRLQRFASLKLKLQNQCQKNEQQTCQKNYQKELEETLINDSRLDQKEDAQIKILRVQLKEKKDWMLYLNAFAFGGCSTILSQIFSIPSVEQQWASRKLEIQAIGKQRLMHYINKQYDIEKVQTKFEKELISVAMSRFTLSQLIKKQQEGYLYKQKEEFVFDEII